MIRYWRNIKHFLGTSILNKLHRHSTHSGYFQIKFMPYGVLPLVLIALSLALPVAAESIKSLDFSIQLQPSTTAQAETTYGPAARLRVAKWQQLIEKNKGKSEWQNIHRVNTFFNKVDFVSDSIHWKQEDYWATPVQFLSTEAGDCEDFSIAKYVTLRALGIPAEKLRLMHVSTLPKKTKHMVLVYMENANATPLVLDNLIRKIVPIQERKDLIPSYSFNNNGLWLPGGPNGIGRKIKDTAGISLWDDVLQRIQRGL